MKKSLLLTAGLFCLITFPVIADCVCGTVGCRKCNHIEEYLEDIGEYFTKQAKKIKKTSKKSKRVKTNCSSNSPVYWLEESQILDEKGNLILEYADLVEEDSFSLTPQQKEKAQKDATAIKEAGEKIKAKTKQANQECYTELTEYEEIDEYPIHTNRMKKEGKKHTRRKVITNMPELFWIEEMQNNGDMLIEAGEFIEENMTK